MSLSLSAAQGEAAGGSRSPTAKRARSTRAAAASTAARGTRPARTLAASVGNTGSLLQQVSSMSQPPASAAAAAPAELFAKPCCEKMLPTAIASEVTKPVQFHSPRATVLSR
jgi:hypothetical protein